MTSQSLQKINQFSCICIRSYGTRKIPRDFGRCMSTEPGSAKRPYKLVVVGGGTGGCATAAKFAAVLGKGNVAVIEPAENHYYQPMFTLVGAGIKQLQNSRRPMHSVLPKKCDWVKDKVVSFDPKQCTVTTSNGHEIKYEYLVVALGLQLNYHLIKGLTESLQHDPSVCSNYWTETVTKTYPALQNFQGGNAIFTFPNTPIKCAGAPQKIMYLAEDYFRRSGKRDKANIVYNTSLGVIFGVKKYAERLTKICEKRDITVNMMTNLVEVRHDKKEAVFQKLGSDKMETETFDYSFLHVTPPMSAPDVLKSSSLVNEAGFLDVNKYTLQHVKYPNIFGIGDCTSLPTSKTAAAVAGQVGVLKQNLSKVMAGKSDLSSEYDGYTSCPLITSRGKCILAEFDYDGNPMETFPFDQGKERRSMYHMKKDVMPELYWKFLLKGMWNGPGTYRKLMRLGIGNVKKPSAQTT